jgi:CDP-diacylglycerol pyrophosphatase
MAGVGRLARLLLLGAALLGGRMPAALAADPDALWKIVHDRCVPDQLQHADPAPCAAVSLAPDAAHGWVVFKDRDGAAQYLLIPTAKITGIEDPAILAPDATNYFAEAWDARGDVLARVGHALPRDAISLAINSPYGRTQDQLHIHIDCIRADVRDALRALAGSVGPDWVPVPLARHAYRARRIDGAELATNPFRVLASDPGVGAAGLGRHTLVVVGASFLDGEGFLLLDDRVDLPTGDRASGEELQDHECAVAHGLNG